VCCTDVTADSCFWKELISLSHTRALFLLLQTVELQLEVDELIPVAADTSSSAQAVIKLTDCLACRFAHSHETKAPNFHFHFTHSSNSRLFVFSFLLLSSLIHSPFLPLLPHLQWMHYDGRERTDHRAKCGRIHEQH
jgi:hypothetical protein